MKSILKSKKGFSLIELIFTMAILLIVTIPLSSYFLVSASNNSKSVTQHKANLLAQQVLEDWKASGKVQLVPKVPTTIPETLVPEVKETVPAGGKLTVIQTAEEVSVTQEATAVVGATPMGAIGAQPTEPSQRLNKDDSFVTIQESVPAAVEDYLSPKGDFVSTINNTINKPIEYTFKTIEGASKISHPNSSGDTIDDTDLSPTSEIEVTLKNGKLIVKYDGSTINKSSLTPYDTREPVDLIFTVENDSTHTIKVTDNDQRLNIYLISAIKSDGTAYPERPVSIAPGIQNVLVYKNMLKWPALSADNHRVYKVTVKVIETDTRKELTTLTSYIKLK